MRPTYDGFPGEFGVAGTSVSVAPSYSKKCVGGWKIPGLAPISTLPSGRSAAGPSATSSCPCAMIGKSGPATQVPGCDGFGGGVYTEVCPVAPTAHTVPSGRRRAGPISWEPPPPAVRSGSLTIVLPALTHLPLVARNCSACVRFAVLLQSTVSTLPSGRRVHPSSLLLSALPVEAAAVHVSVVASRNAAWVEQQLARRNRPSASTTAWASPIVVHPAGGLRSEERRVGKGCRAGWW